MYDDPDSLGFADTRAWRGQASRRRPPTAITVPEASVAARTSSDVRVASVESSRSIAITMPAR